MKAHQSENIFKVLKQLKSMTAMEFVRKFTSQSISLICAIVLSLMAALPVIVSLIYREPVEVIGSLTDKEAIQLINIYTLGSLWCQALLYLGFALGLIAVLVCARGIDGRKLPDILHRARLRAALLPLGLLVMLLWSILSALLSGNLRQCFLGDEYRHEGIVTYCLYAVVFIGAIQVSEKHMKWVAEVLCAVCAITGILVITGGRVLPSLFFVDTELRAAMFHNNNHYGYFLAICFPVCFGLILDEQNPTIFQRILRWGEYWLICNAIAYCSCRGSFLGIAAAMIGWDISVYILHKQKWKKCLALNSIFVITILLLHTESTILDRMWNLMKEVDSVQQTQNPGMIEEMGSGRGILWKYGIQFALEKPLFGYGPDNLGYMYSSIQRDLADRPHNELIQFAASLGFPALICYITAIGSHAASFLRCFRRLSVFHLALFASVGSYLVSSMFGNTMYYTTPYYIMMLAFTYRICNPADTERT